MTVCNSICDPFCELVCVCVPAAFLHILLWLYCDLLQNKHQIFPHCEKIKLPQHTHTHTHTHTQTHHTQQVRKSEHSALVSPRETDELIAHCRREIEIRRPTCGHIAHTHSTQCSTGCLSAFIKIRVPVNRFSSVNHPTHGQMFPLFVSVSVLTYLMLTSEEVRGEILIFVLPSSPRTWSPVLPGGRKSLWAE